MKTFVLLIAFIVPFSAYVQVNKTALKIGDQISLQSSTLQEERILNVYLPNGYDPDSVQTYPVVYVLDGSMDEDMIHITGLVQFCSYSWIQFIPECIVVGISNVNRYRDFTHYPENKEYLESDPRRGGALAFIDFLETEAIPLIDKQYKTNEHRVIIGQSLGGLLSTQILLERPNMFNHYIIISPSLWYDDERLLNRDFAETPSSINSIFIGVGKEGSIMKKVAKKLYRKLRKQNQNTALKFKYFPGHDHGDVLHNAVYLAFETLGYTLKQK